MKPLWLILPLSILCLSSAHAVLALQSFNAASHDRFANDPAFIGTGYDWSGVARASNGSWVTMISSTHFLTSNHFAPTIGNSVIFHEDNNPSGSTITRTVNSITQIGTTDIQIGQLDSTPGSTIATYSIASNTANSATFSSSIYSDRIAFNVGLNNTGTGTTQFRVGRNELDGFIDVAVDGPRIGDSITFNDDRGTLASLGADETFLQAGDSSAPLFVTDGSDLVLVGANWFIATDPNPNLSGASFLPNHITEINAVLLSSGESLSLTSVPEPSSLFSFSIAALALLKRRR